MEIQCKGKWVLFSGETGPEKSFSGFIPSNSDRDKAMTAKDKGASVSCWFKALQRCRRHLRSACTGDYSVRSRVLRINAMWPNSILNKTNNTIESMKEDKYNKKNRNF
jgi:hypothetical protein